MESEEAVHQPLCPSYRLLVSLIALFGECVAYGSQTLVSASLLIMTRHDGGAKSNDTKPVASIPVSVGEFSSSSNKDSDDEWHYHWGSYTRSWLVASFFVGYGVMQLPAGCLTRRYGGHKLIMMTVAVNVLCQALCIWVPHYGPYPVAALLFMSGALTACSYPALIAVAAKWCPPNESSRLMSTVVSGASFGVALVYCVTTGATHIDMLGGWPFIIITIVGMQLVFLTLWWIFVTDSPDENKLVRSSEVLYIQKQFSLIGVDNAKQTDTPWRNILTSPLVLAITSSLFGMDFLGYGLINIFPLYFTDVRHMSRSTVAMLSGLPWLVCPFTAYLVSQGVDMLRERQCLSTSTLRKIADVIAKPVTGIMLLTMSLLPDGHVIPPAILYALSIVTVMSFQGCSWAANVAELSAQHAGSVSSIANSVSVAGSFLAPPLFAALTPHKSADEWQVCFAITLTICVVTSLIYVILGSSQPQDWEKSSK